MWVNPQNPNLGFGAQRNLVNQKPRNQNQNRGNSENNQGNK